MIDLRLRIQRPANLLFQIVQIRDRVAGFRGQSSHALQPVGQFPPVGVQLSEIIEKRSVITHVGDSAIQTAGFRTDRECVGIERPERRQARHLVVHGVCQLGSQVREIMNQRPNLFHFGRDSAGNTRVGGLGLTVVVAIVVQILQRVVVVVDELAILLTGKGRTVGGLSLSQNFGGADKQAHSRQQNCGQAYSRNRNRAWTCARRKWRHAS